MSSNNRVYYASQIAQLKPGGTGVSRFGSWYQPQGVQSVGLTSSVSTEQAFQLGSIDIYGINENVPEVEATISKVLDGTPPLYLMCMGGVSGIGGANFSDLTDATELKTKGLGGLANNVVDFRLGIFDDTKSSVEGTTDDYVVSSGMYLSSASYSFPVDQTATENITLVGTNKYWKKNNAGLPSMSGVKFADGTATAKKLARRQFVQITGSILPTGQYNDKPNRQGMVFQSGGLPTGSLYIQNININTSLNREDINELGKLVPYCKYANFPIEVTSEFEIIGLEGDYIQANDFLFDKGCGVVYSNTNEFPIRLKVCGSGTGSLEIDLGLYNKLTSVNYTGGDASGGNVSITYSFRNYNEFNMKAAGNYASGITVAG